MCNLVVLSPDNPVGEARKTVILKIAKTYSEKTTFWYRNTIGIQCGANATSVQLDEDKYMLKEYDDEPSDDWSPAEIIVKDIDCYPSVVMADDDVIVRDTEYLFKSNSCPLKTLKRVQTSEMIFSFITLKICGLTANFLQVFSTIRNVLNAK